MSALTILHTQKVHIPDIVSLEHAAANAKFIFPNTAEEHNNLLTDKDVSHLILKSESDDIIGFVILAGLKNRSKSIEFRRIVINAKGQGYGRKAIQEIKRMCFEEFNCHRLWLDVLESNERARHLYKSEGFVEEAVLRDSVIVDDMFHNLVIMSILEGEY